MVGHMVQSNESGQVYLQGVEQNQPGGAFVDLTQGETAYQNNYPLEGGVQNDQVAVCGEIQQQQQLVGVMETQQEVVAMETLPEVIAMETQQEVVTMETQQETPPQGFEAPQASNDVIPPIRIRKPSQESCEYPNLNDDVINNDVIIDETNDETAKAEQVDDVSMDMGMLDSDWMDPGFFCPPDLAEEAQNLIKKDSAGGDVINKNSTDDFTQNNPCNNEVRDKKLSPEYIESLEAKKENLTVIKNNHVGQYLWETGKFR